MKHLFFSLLMTLAITFTNAHTSFAQDYTIMNLPEGAKARFGKSWAGEMQYSPDGTKLAVASGIGVWLYETQRGKNSISTQVIRSRS